MRMNLAAQVLSRTMSVVLADRGENDLMAISLYCEMVDCFDFINVCSVNEEIRKPFLTQMIS